MDTTISDDTALRELNFISTEKDSTPNQRCRLTAEPAYSNNAPVVEEAGPAGYDAPPDGGLVAWLQVAGSFFLFFNSWYDLVLNFSLTPNDDSTSS